ncbi:MAG: hypothetical protein ACOY3N_09500 [Bradyrhizobium sp.]|uniref:hypothetical protein n=1 Tax=Bradyrhizobium sp. TaxID=376 RepID=UPI003BF094B2
MKQMLLVPLTLVLAGCFASRQEVASQLGAQYLGRSVDELVTQFGPPASSFKMTSGGSSYLWQLAAVTDVNVDRGYGTMSTRGCKVKVVTDPSNVIVKLDTEDASASTGVYGMMGIGGSICAQRLGIQRQT